MVAVKQMVARLGETDAPLYARTLGRLFHWSADARAAIPLLRAALADSQASEEDRLEAAQGLAMFGEPPEGWLPAIVVKLKSPDSSRRILAMDALAYIGLPAVVATPDLIRLLESSDAKLRLKAVQTLRLLRPPLGDVAGPLVERLSDDDFDVQDAAAGALAARGRAAVAWLIPQLIRSEKYSRRKVVGVLDSIGWFPLESADVLIDSFLDDAAWSGGLIFSFLAPNPRHCALCWFDSHQPVIQRMLHRAEPKLRCLAISFIASLRVVEPEWTDALAAATADTDPNVRDEAIWALGRQDPTNASIITSSLKATGSDAKSHPSHAVKILSECLIGRSKLGQNDAADRSAFLNLLCIRARDEYSRVREESAEELGRLEAREALPELRRLLSDPDFDVRRAAGRSLKKITGEVGDHIEVLVNALEDADRFLSACQELQSMSGAAAGAIPALLSRWDDADAEIRQVLARTIAAIAPDHAVVPPLLENADPEIRIAAWRGLASADACPDKNLPAIEAAFNEAAALAETGLEDEARVAARALWELTGNRSGKVTMLVVDQLLSAPLYDCKQRIIFNGASFEELRHYWPEQLAELEKIVLADPPLIQLVIGYTDNRYGDASINACRLVWKLQRRADLVMTTLSSSLVCNGNLESTAAIAELVTELGPRAKAALPAILRLLADRYWLYRWYGIQMLGSIGPAAREALPNLFKVLEENAGDDFFSYLWKAGVTAIGAIRPEVKKSVPALLDAVENRAVCRSISRCLADLGEEGLAPFLAAYAKRHAVDER